MGVSKTMDFSIKIFQHDLILDDFVGTPILGPLWVWVKNWVHTPRLDGQH